MKVPVEILYFDGCPHHDDTRRLVERVAAELQLAVELRTTAVNTHEAAERRRFLGSPTVRVAGRDVEPGADERTDFSRSCRVYATPNGLVGQPQETWIREALHGAD